MHTLLIRQIAKKSCANISLKLSLTSCMANYTSVTKNACSEAMRRKKQKKWTVPTFLIRLIATMWSTESDGLVLGVGTG